MILHTFKWREKYRWREKIIGGGFNLKVEEMKFKKKSKNSN